MGQLACLDKMTLVRRQGHFAKKSQAFKALTGLPSNKSDNRNHKNLLGSNKPRPFKAPAGHP